MKRRSLLQGMATLPFMGALGGCRETETPAKGTLRLILHGPFGVVTTRRENQYRIIAFVPSDPNKLHELRFRTPGNFVGDESRGKRFQFELGKPGLQISNRTPYRDHGFDDFNLGNIGEWQPDPGKYFVFLDLPAPDIITFIPPARAVLFQDHRSGSMPLDQILEYRMRDAKDVRIRSKELGDQPPLSCQELVQEYRKHWASPEHKEPSSPPEQRGAPMSQRPSLDAAFARCSDSDVATFFFGVGLAESKYSDPQLESHGIQFFNHELLKAFSSGSRTPSAQLESRVDRLRLARSFGYSLNCQSAPPIESAPRPSTSLPPSGYPSPAVYRDWMPEPRLQTVASVHDCMVGGVSACTSGC